MDQTIINWLLGGLGSLIGFLLHAVWQAVKDLQYADKQLVEKVSQIEVSGVGYHEEDIPERRDDEQRLGNRRS